MGRQPLVWLFLILVGVYIALSYAVPIAPETVERYDLSPSDAIWLRTAVLIPMLIIWFIALYGFLRLLQYAATIKGAPESGPVSDLAKGLMVLAFGFPLAGIASAFTTLQSTGNNELLTVATIFRNYIQVLFPLIAFVFIAKGAEALARTVRLRPNKLHVAVMMLGFILLASIYTFLMIAAPFSEENLQDVYHLPVWLIVATIIIPYLFTWYSGIAAAYYIIRYRQQVGGLIYKSAFGRFASGLLVITATAIAIRVLITLSEQLFQLNISPLLAIVYALLLFYGIGYGLVANGANRLTKLEKV